MLKRKASPGALAASSQRPLKHTAQPTYPSASQEPNGLAEEDTLKHRMLAAEARITELERMLAKSEMARQEAEEWCGKFKSQLDSHAQKAALRREAKVHAAAAAARESSRMEWQLEHMDDQWDVPEINSKLGVSFAHYEYEEAFERLREYIEDGKLSMDSEHYAQWRHEYEQKRKKKMGDAYVFERTDTDDDHKYEPENDEDDDEDDDADDY